MVITNPTDKDITVSIEGQMYTVEANSSTSGIREKHAIHWVEQLHNFLVISPEKAKEVAPKVEVPKVAEIIAEAKDAKDKK